MSVGSGRLRVATALASVCLLLGQAGFAAGSAPSRVVVEGVAPLPAQGVGLRTTALRNGLDAAISQVGLDLIRAGGRSAPGDLDVLELLGGEPTDYALRYRVLADRGERRAPDGAGRDAREYALEIEVHVDVDRVAAGLRAAGWLETVPGQLPAESHRVIVETSDWGAYAAFLAVLREAGGARSAVPEAFQAGAATLRVEAPGRTSELLDRLMRGPSPGLVIVPIPSPDAELRVQVRREPPAEASP